MLYMITERFKSGDPKPVYSRFQSEGRLAPAGLRYCSSWVSGDLTTCYQLMETESRELIDEWISNWSDLVDFEVVPVITSAEATAKVLGAGGQSDGEGGAMTESEKGDGVPLAG